jgi:hypothetical protein
VDSQMQSIVSIPVLWVIVPGRDSSGHERAASSLLAASVSSSSIQGHQCTAGLPDDRNGCGGKHARFRNHSASSRGRKRTFASIL